MADETQVPEMMAPELEGLGQKDVAERVADGRYNAEAGPKTKSIPQIFAEHVFTLFNGVNLALAILVISTGSYRNLTFVVVVCCNLVMGLVQEIRSKRIIDKLSILASRPVTVRRGGKDVEVAHNEVVLDDLIVLRRGDQVPADAEVAWGEGGLNESLLTGESKPVTKRVGDKLMSGSFLDYGAVVARVNCVGAQSYAARINAEAKYVKKARSEIMATLNMIIRWATFLMIPAGLALFLRSLQTGSTPSEAILSMVAAVTGMIPQGLVLLTSTVLVVATARLAQKKVLIQQFFCIEMLARVDVLCLDKTGTITSGSMDFESSVGVRGHEGDEVVLAAASVCRANSLDANETATAILRYADKAGIETPEFARVIPFSSARKYSGCVTADGKNYVMGAMQFVFGGNVPAEISEARAASSEFARVLAVAECDGFDEENGILGEVRPLGVLSLSDHIRSNAPDTIRYFIEQGVTLNVISGDDPHTVASIAAEAGVPDADKWVDASTLEADDDVREAAAKYHVFGRVTPAQKRLLVEALREAGHTVAMTGDGVNDVLALREADCSVAMASGSDAARNVSEVVLVDDDFAHLPDVVAEGRRGINNLQRSASLFLVKTVFSAVLAFFFACFPPYPFQPVQMSLISSSVIGLPSIVLGLEPNHERVRGRFLANVLARSLPASIAIIITVCFASCALGSFGFTAEQVSTICVILTLLVGGCLVLRISVPMNPIRAVFLIYSLVYIICGFTIFSWFFDITAVTFEMAIASALIGAVGLVIFNVLFNRGVSLASEDGGYTRLIDKIESYKESRK